MRYGKHLWLVILLAMAMPAAAQSTSLFSGRSPTNPNLGTSPGGITGSSMGMGSGMTGGLTTSLGGMGGLTGLTGTGMGATGATGSMGTGGQSGFVGRGNTGFVGNRMAQQGATGGAGQSQLGGRTSLGQSQLGRRTTTSRQGQSQLGRSSTNAFGGGGAGMFGAAGGQFGRGGSATQAAIQVRQRLAFTYTPAPQAQVVTRLRGEFQRIAPHDVAFAGVSMTTAPGGVVVLRGTVPTAQAAALAEAVLRLEPGVDQVRNELQVAGSSATSP